MVSWRWMGVAVLAGSMSAAPQVAGAVTYQFTYGMFGDSAGPVDINDHGDIAWTGFGDKGSCPCGYIQNGGGPTPNGWLTPLEYGDTETIDAINNAGWVLGTTVRPDKTSVQTVWIAGVPKVYDPASQPFVPDPGPSRVPFDLASLTVLDLPANVAGAVIQPTALTNARGDLVFGYGPTAGSIDESYGILRPITEPPPLALILTVLVPMGLYTSFGRARR